MRYCYARLLSVGNPSGPVKYAGQPQYDSEQVVSPLFTFAMPPTSPPPPPPATKSAPMQLALAPFVLKPTAITGGAKAEWSAFSLALHKAAAERAKAERAAASQAPPAGAAEKDVQARLARLEAEESSLKSQLHAQAAKKAAATRSVATSKSAVTAPHKLAIVAAPKKPEPIHAAVSHAPPVPVDDAEARAVAAADARAAAATAAARKAAANLARLLAGSRTTLRSAAAPAQLDTGLATHYWDADARAAMATLHSAAAARRTVPRTKKPVRLDLALAKHYFQSRAKADPHIRAAADPWLNPAPKLGI